mgnify:CR=1 FL=1
MGCDRVATELIGRPSQQDEALKQKVRADFVAIRLAAHLLNYLDHRGTEPTVHEGAMEACRTLTLQPTS